MLLFYFIYSLIHFFVNLMLAIHLFLFVEGIATGSHSFLSVSSRCCPRTLLQVATQSTHNFIRLVTCYARSVSNMHRYEILSPSNLTTSEYQCTPVVPLLSKLIWIMSFNRWKKLWTYRHCCTWRLNGWTERTEKNSYTELSREVKNNWCLS